jgi:glycosyltransferase involved in cell wall biosynthesis
MRILLLGDIRPTHLKRWRDYFRSKGHEVHVASLECDPSDSDYEQLTIKVPVRSLRYLSSGGAARRVIDCFKPDIVNGHFLPTYGLLAAVSGFRPIAVSLWGSDVLVSARKSPLHRARALWILRRAQLVTSDSAYMTSETHRLGRFEARIVTEPMGLPEKLQQRLESHSPETASTGITIISTRRLEPLYRVDVLIDALILCGAKLGRFRCLICGDGSERSRLESMCRSYGLDSVSFLGWCSGDQYAKVLSGVDIYISCSESDSTSVSLLEAMSAGAFPVASDILGNREWIVEGETGFTFPVGDASALADRLIEAANSPGLRASAAIKNRETVRQRATWERNMAVIEGAFAELVERTKK